MNLPSLSLFLLSINAFTVNAATFSDKSSDSSIYYQPNIESQSSLFFSSEKKLTSPANEKKNFLKESYIAIEKLISNKQYVEARRQLQNHQNKTDANIYNLIGKLDLHENKILSAKQSFNKSLAIHQNNLLAYQGLAKISLIEKKLSETKKSIDKMLSIDKNYYLTYIIESEYFYQKNNLNQAEQSLLVAYSKVEKKLPLQLKVLSILSKFYANQNKLANILPPAKMLYKNNADNIPAISFYATNLVANKKFSEAEALLKKIIQINPKDVSHRILLAKILSNQPEKANEVISLFEEAYSLNKKNLNILVLKASFLIKLKKYEQAINTANLFISTEPDSAIGYQLKGDIYKASNKKGLAIKAYKLALNKDRGTTAALSLASFYVRDKQYSQAINLLKRQLGKVNDPSAIFFKLATIYEKKDNFAKAEFYYKEILKLRPNHVLSLNNLAQLYILQSNPNALKLAKKAYDKTRNSPAIADTYGYAQVLFGDSKIGLQLLEHSAKQAPKILDIQAHLAVAHMKQGHNDRAIQLLEKITKINQYFFEKENAQKLLQQLKK